MMGHKLPCSNVTALSKEGIGVAEATQEAQLRQRLILWEMLVLMQQCQRRMGTTW